MAEQLAVDRACRLFGAEHANVKPRSAAQANAAVHRALLEPGATILTIDPAHRGQITRGAPTDI